MSVILRREETDMIDWLVNLIKNKINSGFCGSIRINMSFGGITNVNIEESIKPPKI